MCSKLELRDVSFRFGSFPVLKNVNLAVAPGDVAIVGGRSGCGKSTFLEICAALLTPQSGSVLWDDMDISQVSKYDLYHRRRSVGYVFQVHALISNHTVFDNIALPLRSSTDQSDSDIRNRVFEQMEELNISGIDKALPEVLSAAQLKAVALARALVKRPRLLLLDEPLSGVDPFTAQSIIDVLHNRWKRENMSIVMISHALNAWPEWNAKRLMLNNGLLETAADHFRVAKELVKPRKETGLWNTKNVQ